MVKSKYPKVKLMVRAKNRYAAYEFLNMEIDHIYRESLETSLKLASEVLSQMGFRKYTLQRQIQNFIKYDEDSLRRLAKEGKIGDDNYIFKARKELEQQEKLLEQDFKRGIVEFDSHWDAEQIRKSLDDSSF